jgi:hypothetical protein
MLQLGTGRHARAFVLIAGNAENQRMTGFLNEDEIAALTPSELVRHRTPIPTQIVASDEYYPPPQSEQQREVESRILAMADDLGRRQGLGPSAVLLDRCGNGRFIRGDERGLWADFRCDGRRGRDAAAILCGQFDSGAGMPARGAVNGCLIQTDPLLARGYWGGLGGGVRVCT